MVASPALHNIPTILEIQDVPDYLKMREVSSTSFTDAPSISANDTVSSELNRRRLSFRPESDTEESNYDSSSPRITPGYTAENFIFDFENNELSRSSSGYSTPSVSSLDWLCGDLLKIWNQFNLIVKILSETEGLELKQMLLIPAEISGNITRIIMKIFNIEFHFRYLNHIFSVSRHLLFRALTNFKDFVPALTRNLRKTSDQSQHTCRLALQKHNSVQILNCVGSQILYLLHTHVVKGRG